VKGHRFEERGTLFSEGLKQHRITFEAGVESHRKSGGRLVVRKRPLKSIL
jgi:hypothetical protein